MFYDAYSPCLFFPSLYRPSTPTPPTLTSVPPLARVSSKKTMTWTEVVLDGLQIQTRHLSGSRSIFCTRTSWRQWLLEVAPIRTSGLGRTRCSTVLMQARGSQLLTQVEVTSRSSPTPMMTTLLKTHLDQSLRDTSDLMLFRGTEVLHCAGKCTDALKVCLLMLKLKFWLKRGKGGAFGPLPCSPLSSLEF